jgi:hypothetical protein
LLSLKCFLCCAVWNHSQHFSKESKSGASKILADQIRNNPDQISSSLSDVNNRMETERYAFPFVSYWLFHLLSPHIS